MHASLLIILFIINLNTLACRDGANLDDIMNDPDIRRILSQPISPRHANLEDTPELSPSEARAQELERLRSEYENIKDSRHATPAEVARLKNRIENLEAEQDFERLLAQPISLSSDNRVPVRADEDSIRRLLGEEPEAPTSPNGVDDVLDEDMPDADIEVTDEDRRAFAELLSQPVVTPSQRNPYDLFINDARNASSAHPVDVRLRDPVTGEMRDAEVIEFLESTDTDDFVRLRYTTMDGRTVTRRINASRLTAIENGRDVNLSDTDIIRDSERYNNLSTDDRASFAVNRMSADAITSESRRRYREIQDELDERGLSFERMDELISEQVNIQRSHSPLTLTEIETVELNLEGLNNGTSLHLTPGEKRAIAQIQEIRDIRAGNAYVSEDVDIMNRISNVSEESILAARRQNRTRAVNREIKALTGEGLDIPFSRQREWNSTAVSRAVGGITGRVRIKEAIDAISVLDRNGRIISSDQAREINQALRTLDSEIRSKSLQDSPQAAYLQYIRLQLERYNLTN